MSFQGIRGIKKIGGRGFQLYSGGVQMLISIELGITCDFPELRVQTTTPPHSGSAHEYPKVTKEQGPKGRNRQPGKKETFKISHFKETHGW